MLNEQVVATLEEYVRQMRAEQNQLIARLREAENEVAILRQEIAARENSAVQTEQAIDTIIVSTRTGGIAPSLGRSIRLDDEYEIGKGSPRANTPRERTPEVQANGPRSTSSVAYLNQHRSIPSIAVNREAISQRFSDRTITQACTLLLRESGGSLHVNELYNLLVAGGMKFKGNNPTISIAVSLNRNRRFRKVEPGTFDLIMREASQAAS